MQRWRTASLAVLIFAACTLPVAAIDGGAVTWHDPLFTSDTNLSATGNTGVIATPSAGVKVPMFLMYLEVVGNNMATDETNDLTIDWYSDAAGTIKIGTTTFAQMTASAPIPPVEAWPGDVTGFSGAANLARDGLLPPYMKITYTLAGTTKSMGFVLYGNYWRRGA